MERTCELIKQAKEGNKEAQSILVEENSGLIWSVVKRFQGRGYDKEDLFQIGSIGLLKCIENFDLERNVKFSTYAVPLIMGEIKRFLRDDGIVKVSRSLKEASYKIKREKEHYQKLYNREPTLKEIAVTLDMDESDILMAMESGQEVCSLHQVIYQSEGDEIHLEDKLEQQADLIEQTVDNIYVQELLKKLNEQERQIIHMRYFQNQTQAAIAKKIGISQVQVSRMEKKILNKLRKNANTKENGNLVYGDFSGAGGFASVFCEDKEIEKKIKNIVLYEFDEKNEKEGRVFLSILLLIEKISEQIPYGEVRNTGETDMVIYYKAEELKSKKWVQVIKILFICATCFFGAGITVMGYNNDVDMVKVFGQLYKVFLGTKPDDPTFVELFYSVGLALGIFLFFNHVPGKKVTNEPTPIQVQMRLYEQDVNRTFLLGASRKGEELDVSGNNDSANNK